MKMPSINFTRIIIYLNNLIPSIKPSEKCIMIKTNSALELKIKKAKLLFKLSRFNIFLKESKFNGHLFKYLNCLKDAKSFNLENDF